MWCPLNTRCGEQKRKSNNIINSILNNIVKNVYVYKGDLTEDLTVLKQNIPINTRCDVLWEKYLKNNEQNEKN